MKDVQISLGSRAKIFKALGHPTRLMFVDALAHGELCVCHLQEMAGSDMSTVSKHLSVLKEAGVVHDEKRGTFVYYSLKLPCITEFMACLSTGACC